jgi:hypothetical protein
MIRYNHNGIIPGTPEGEPRFFKTQDSKIKVKIKPKKTFWQKLKELL